MLLIRARMVMVTFSSLGEVRVMDIEQRLLDAIRETNLSRPQLQGSGKESRRREDGPRTSLLRNTGAEWA